MRHLVLIAMTVLGTPAVAQTPPPAATDELAQNLFAPDLVLKYRQEIGLDDAQSKALKELVQKAQGRYPPSEPVRRPGRTVRLR